MPHGVRPWSVPGRSAAAMMALHQARILRNFADRLSIPANWGVFSSFIDMRGRFITFEGGEGTGKSTHCALLSDRLKNFGINLVLTREPGGSPGAEAIRHVLMSGAAKPLGAEAEAMLFAAARDDHVRNTIEPALLRGSWVISDSFHRFYQGISGHVGSRGPEIHPSPRKNDGRQPQARSYIHPRRAGRYRTFACQQAARREGRRSV